MGYTTTFTGSFKFNKKLDPATHDFLTKLSETRRMKRNFPNNEHGVEGEFYVEDDDKAVVDHNHPPSTQPGLWLQWVPNDKGTRLLWNGREKFYEYIPWLQYLIDKILIPRGYSLSGRVLWRGEDRSDKGTIQIVDNLIYIKEGHHKDIAPNSIKYFKE